MFRGNVSPSTRLVIEGHHCLPRKSDAMSIKSAGYMKSPLNPRDFKFIEAIFRKLKVMLINNKQSQSQDA